MKAEEMKGGASDRTAEWFVPKFGPARMRSFIGLLFLPYTGMVLSFSLIGAMLAQTVYWDRVAAILLIFFFGLGIGAHALDALGSKGAKPWGAVFSRLQLWLLAVASLAVAYGIAIYYAIAHVPLLWSMALIEGFFVFAYNLEWFNGRFHTDTWFAISWGGLPVLSGYIMQTNTLSLPALVVCAAAACFSIVEIKASRPYRALKREREKQGRSDSEILVRFETVLKSISIGVLLLGAGMAISRMGM